MESTFPSKILFSFGAPAKAADAYIIYHKPEKINTPRMNFSGENA